MVTNKYAEILSSYYRLRIKIERCKITLHLIQIFRTNTPPATISQQSNVEPRAFLCASIVFFPIVLIIFPRSAKYKAVFDCSGNFPRINISQLKPSILPVFQHSIDIKEADVQYMRMKYRHCYQRQTTKELRIFYSSFCRWKCCPLDRGVVSNPADLSVQF